MLQTTLNLYNFNNNNETWRVIGIWKKGRWKILKNLVWIKSRMKYNGIFIIDYTCTKNRKKFYRKSCQTSKLHLVFYFSFYIRSLNIIIDLKTSIKKVGKKHKRMVARDFQTREKTLDEPSSTRSIRKTFLKPVFHLLDACTLLLIW